MSVLKGDIMGNWNDTKKAYLEPDLSGMELPCGERRDCENCIYFGRPSDAPGTVEKDCLYFLSFDSEYSEL